MQNLIEFLPEKPQPVAIRYGVTAAMVGLTFLIRLGIEGRAGPYGFILFVPAIVAASILFDRGSGFVAVGLSMLSVAPMVDWTYGANQHLASLAVFSIIGTGLALISEGMRKAIERALQAEREKDLLLRELSHRFQNSFAMALSILSMQARALAEPSARTAIEGAASRLRAIGEAQGHLRADGKGDVEMDNYLERLCRSLGDALRGVRPVAVRVHAEPITLPAEKAVPIGLIVNELVTNAFKYAFPAGEDGTVTVRLADRSPDALQLEVADNGVGCPPEAREGVGSSLVRLLVQQLGGSIERHQQNPGCRVVTVLPRDNG
jgi:two-component sensor histidine kinase